MVFIEVLDVSSVTVPLLQKCSLSNKYMLFFLPNTHQWCTSCMSFMAFSS